MTMKVEIKTFGDAVRWTMQQRNKTMRDVQSECDIGISTISRVVNGKECTLRTGRLLAGWCRLTPKEFWDLTKPE